MTQNEFNKIIPTYHKDLFRYALFLIGNPDQAKDLVQTTYLKALKKRESFADETNLRGWLCTILKNTFIDHYHANKHFSETLILLEDLSHIKIADNKCNSPESSYMYSELKDVISQIPFYLRKPFLLMVDGYKYEEISKELKVNLGTIKSRIFFARKAIMDILKNDHKFNNLKPSKMETLNNSIGGRAPDELNDIAKTNIMELVIKALTEEKLMKSEAALLLKLSASSYLSMITKPNQWSHCGIFVWEQLLAWVNSGKSIRKYGEGVVLPEKKERKVKKEIAIPTGTAEAMVNLHKSAKDKPPKKIKMTTRRLSEYFLKFGKGEPVFIGKADLDSVIKQVKTLGSKYYYDGHDGAEIYEANLVYRLRKEEVETRF